ncbi:MAG: hypothetical protein Q4B71_05185 [Cardiobacteriaceae bacterium]|nr:hypothetical protein [Cardiobacteriaceae bacterium]
MKEIVKTQDWSESIKEGVKLAFSGLSTKYYTRQAIIGLGLAVVLVWIAAPRHQPSLAYISFIISMLINAALYPYARFVYEKVAELVVGDEEVFKKGLLSNLVKLIMMLLCFMFATLLAPLGLLYLYYVQTQDDDDVEALEESLKQKTTKVRKAVREKAEDLEDVLDDEDEESLGEKVKKKSQDAKKAIKSKMEKVKETLEDDEEEYEEEEDEEEEIVKPKRKTRTKSEEDEE